MTLPAVPPRLPHAAPQYSEQEQSRLLKELELFIARLNATGPLRGTTLNLSSLPTNPIGLAVGTMWQDSSGVLHVIRSQDQYFLTLSGMTGRIGAVTTVP